MDKTLGQLPTHQVITDSQDLQPIIQDFHKKLNDFNLVRNQITGAAVLVGDGEYTSVYFTEASNPWRTGAIYTQIL